MIGLFLIASAYATPVVWTLDARETTRAVAFRLADWPIEISPERIREVATRFLPDVAIHSGAIDGRFAKRVARLTKRGTLLVNIGDPGRDHQRFGLIVSPADEASAPGNFRVPSLPSAVNAAALTAARARYAGLLASLPRPRVAVLLGGPEGGRTYTSGFARDLGARVAFLARAAGGSVLAANESRATEPTTRAFRTSVTSVPFYFAPADGAGAYLAVLAFADVIVVAGPSLRMIRDAAATAQPLLLSAPSVTIGPRHKRALLNLISAGRARWLGEDLHIWPATPVDVAGDVAREIRRRLSCSAGLDGGG